MYYSQMGQDQFLYEKIFNYKDGFFIDIGAFDGIQFSNTYFFEKELNWKGICIEPNFKTFSELVKNRNNICLNYAITSDSENLLMKEFLDVHDQIILSGFPEEYTSFHKAMIKTGRTSNNEDQIITVKSISLNYLLDFFNIEEVDYISLDTEGSEYKILSDFNFKKYKIKCFTVENWKGEKQKELDELFLKNGYSFVTKIKELDDVYILND